MNFRSQNKMSRESGFSLLEVLIALSILVVLSFAIYQATTETYRLRDVLSNEGDFYNEIRLSMNILQRDISLLYSPTVSGPPKPSPQPVMDPREMQNILASDLGQTTTFWGAVTDKTGIRPAHFIGTDSKLSFISVSNTRVYKDSPESEFAKVVYELKPDAYAVVPSTSVLTKSTSSNAFEVDEHKDRQFVQYPLLHGIKKLKYRYYHKEKDAWSTSWDSDREDYKNIYPDIIEIKIEVLGPSRLSFDGLFQFRPEVPLDGLDPST